jgi:hypothetical protein
MKAHFTSFTSPCLAFALWLALVLGCASSRVQPETPIPPKQTLISGFKAVPLTPGQYRAAREAVNSLSSIKGQYEDGKVTFESMQMTTSRAGDDISAAGKALPPDADVAKLINAAGTGYIHALSVWAVLINYRGNGNFNRSAQQQELAKVDRIFDTKGLPTKKKLEKILSVSGTATARAKELLDQAGQ